MWVAAVTRWLEYAICVQRVAGSDLGIVNNGARDHNSLRSSNKVSLLTMEQKL